MPANTESPTDLWPFLPGQRPDPQAQAQPSQPEWPQQPRQAQQPGQPRRGRLMAAFAAGGLVLVALVAVVLVTQLGHFGSPVTEGSAAPADVRSSTSSAARKQAAIQLSGLLAQSVKDRSAILAAAHDVDVCGPQLKQEPKVFADAATSRQKLLTQLAGLSGRSALSSAMLADLTSAWQNSIQADQDLATWARDEASRRCKRYQSNPAAAAAVGPSDQATAAKQAFARLWDPTASQYGLPTYQPDQL